MDPQASRTKCGWKYRQCLGRWELIYIFFNHERVYHFNDCYRFDIMFRSNPDNWRKYEQFFIIKLNSLYLYPFGLNQVAANLLTIIIISDLIILKNYFFRSMYMQH